MNKPLIIGITGGSGSGKTTFVKKLRERFSEDELCIVSQDEYYKPKERQKADDQGVINFDLPDSIDKKAFRQDILTLISGAPVHRKEYTFNNPEASARELVFKPAPIILVEGIFVLHFRRIRSLIDLKVFLYAKENLKVIRRIRRDQKERNYGLEDVLYRYEHHVLPAFEQFVKPYIGEADIVINNNHDLELGIAVISGYLRNCLHELEQRC
jgi:uridine kinase